MENQDAERIYENSAISRVRITAHQSSLSSKKTLKNRLSQLIESQEESIIDTTPTSFCCRHCKSNSIKKWGKSQGLQRYKCNDKNCGKTFNVLTGTPLAGLRHKDKWLDSLLCMQDSLL